MRAFRRWLPVVLVLLSSAAAQQSAQPSDQATAASVLGPRWKQLSRRAGMIFAGTVLSAAPEAVSTQAVSAQTTATDSIVAGSTPSIELIFRVDEPIAGVERGQILTIHEWAGAWSMHRPMTPGQRILIFLYPPSRLGLTSPVGGSLGQIALDSNGKNVSAHAARNAAAADSLNQSPSRQQPRPDAASVTVLQLKRAIRAARNRNGNGSERE
ncbi:MAG: hypothetical protein WBX02_03680 [Terriglobales bacterium]